VKDQDKITGHAVVVTLATDPTYFTDNVLGQCHFCARAVQYRPHVPTPHTLVCRICFAERFERGDQVAVTPRTVREFDLFRSRN